MFSRSNILIIATLLFSLSLNALSASEVTEENILENPMTTPLLYTVQSDTDSRYFSLLGASHDYPYEWIHPNYRKKIEAHDILVHECNDCEETGRDMLKIYQDRFPRTEEDDDSFKNFIQYLEATLALELDAVAFLTKEIISKFKLCVEKFQLNFGITLEIFNTEVINSHIRKNGMDGELDVIFKDAEKPRPGLLDPSEQIVSFDDDTKLIFTQENAMSLIFNYFLPSTPKYQYYPPSLESCAEVFKQAVEEGSSLATRDESFCYKTLAILEQWSEKNILIMLGCNHLPYILDFFKENGFSVTKQ